MADELKMDPARIERLRDPARLDVVDPGRILELAQPEGVADVVDVGAGVGFVTFPLARALAPRRIIACDVLEGMLTLLAEDAQSQGLANVTAAHMSTHTTLPLESHSASLLVMLQVHHELDDAQALLTDCARVLAPNAPLVIVDWKDEDLPDMPRGGRRVALSRIADDVRAGGFDSVETHTQTYRLHNVVIGRTNREFTAE